ncbi:TPA: hypothetical protein ACSH5C_000434 [Legionella pneumophila]|nr:hypothetical protein [Legionella pneumophila]
MSRIGSIAPSFHFLGVNYLSTQPADNTTLTHTNDDLIAQNDVVYSLAIGGGVRTSNHQAHLPICIVPHARTLRKARTQVQFMVSSGFSTRRIRSYLHYFVLWWVNTTRIWNYEEIIKWFCEACFELQPAAVAAGGLLLKRIRESHSRTACHLLGDGLVVAARAA